MFRRIGGFWVAITIKRSINLTFCVVKRIEQDFQGCLTELPLEGIASATQDASHPDNDPPTATVAACYSKRRREDSQVLHPEVVQQLKAWLDTRRLKPGELLFPISGRVPGGIDRKAFKMIERDLAAARKAWIEAARHNPTEKRRREESDFLAHKSHAGLYADFHSLRHYFITSLARNGVSPKMAQTLARHSDIRLTLGLYTHVELHDQTAAIEALPGPPAAEPSPRQRQAV